jgi:hypothetical protein
LLEKLSLALDQVDGSSGALGTAVNRAIDAVVPVIAGVDAPAVMRERWLSRLPRWQTELYIRIFSLLLKRDNRASSPATSNAFAPGIS